MKEKTTEKEPSQLLLRHEDGAAEGADKQPEEKDHSQIILACAALAILGGKIEGYRIGASVEVEVEHSVIHKGVISDYVPGSTVATVLLHNNPVPSIFPLKSIRTAQLGVDFPKFSSGELQVILSTLVLFLKPHPIPVAYSPLYFYMKARAMKVIELLITIPESAKYMLENVLIPTLVENALQVLPLEEEPKITRLELQGALLREKIFEFTYKYLQRGEEEDGQEDVYESSDKEDHDEDEHENGEGEGSSTSSSGKEDPEDAEVTQLHNSSQSSGEEQKEPEEITAGHVGKIRWRDIRIGSPMLVSRREKIGSARSNWVTAMDNTIGSIGIVKALDKRHHQVLLEFYDPDTASTSQWWFCYDILHIPDDFVKTSLQVIHEAQQLPQLVELDSSTEMSLFILYSRQTVLSLIGNTQITSFSALGGVKNLVQILQIATNEPPQNPYQERWRIFDNRQSPSIRHLQAKLTAVLRMEEHTMKGGSRSQVRVETPPLLHKAGFLYKQNKLFKTWKKGWFVLQGGYLTEYKSAQVSSPVGVIDLTDFVSAEDVKKSKIFAKKEFTFQITTNRSTHLFQTGTEEDRDDWIQRLKEAAAFAQANAKSQIGPNFTDYLTREVIRHFKETSTEMRPCLVEESLHPYPLETKSKKVLRLEYVESVIIVFDPQCSTTPGMDILRFYKNPACTELIASFSGRGPSAFPPLVIPSGQFWVTFSTESSAAEWGYKFYVHALRRKLTDERMMGKPSFDLAYTISDWLLNLDSSWAREFYCNGTYEALLYYLDSSPPLHHKIKILSCLTRLTQRYREFPKDSRPDLLKLDRYRKGLFSLYVSEKAIGEVLHSIELQRLVEWMIHIEIAEQYRRLNISKDERDKEKEREKEKQKERTEYAWFYTSVKTTALMRQLIRGENFPRDFIKEACMEDRKHILVEESPHPYPNGVRVTNTVHIPNAQSLIITFDPRSSTEPNCDYLMFSRVAVGGDELGFFTGEFPSQPLVITGDRFIWSFFSDSAGHDWGFRFSVTPQFSEEITREMEAQCEADCEYLTNGGIEWTLTMDHELVKFINSVCDKIKKSAYHIRLEQYNFSELLHAHPLLVGVPPQALALRFALLKHLNSHLTSLIPLVDLRLITEDWSLAFLVCGLRGHIFHETKTELLQYALSRTKSQGRRAVVTLNRQPGEKGQTLFEQGFKQLNHLDPARLKHLDKAWEVKLQKEGAQDAGGPYRETITQFCADIQSKELKLFIPCPNAKEEVGFNQDKFVPNPKATSPQQLAMFEFIGKLIGIAVRTKNCLDLSLPSLVWKPLVCIRTDRADLEAVDKRCCQYLDAIANNGKNSSRLSPEAFNEYIFETFTIQASDGSMAELKPGGKSIAVTWENRMEFVTLAEQFRLNEFKLQIDAILRGVTSVIPIQLLYLCTWQELELKVVGRAGVDLRLLRKHTRYCGVSPNERHVLMFWKVLETFTPEELTLFIRFVWGRSKLPSSNEFYTAQFQLQSFSRETSNENPDEFMPEAQTCFFSLALPRYSSPEIMKQKLLYAITTCRDIDADFLVPDQGDDR